MRDHNLGRRVLWLDYEAYAPLAEKALARIVDEAQARWPGARLAIHHRTGRLEIGEASVVIAVATPHRADAFAACRYAIERIKQIVPIWKHEHFEGGEVWIEGATADPDDEAARAGGAEDRMRVNVKLFARLRELVGAGELARRRAGRRDGRATCGRRSWRRIPAAAAYERVDVVRGERRTTPG